MAVPDPTALTSADQALIDSQVNASIQPQVDALKAAQAAYDAHQAAVRSDIGSFTTAAGKLTEPIGGNIAGEYNTAATNTAAFGKGFSDGLQAVMSRSQGEADRALTLGGQTQAIAATDKIVNPGAGATDAFYAVHGYNPAAALSAAGAAKSAEGYAQPGLMAARGQNLIFAAVKAAEAGDKDWQDKIAAVWATAPQLRTQITTAIQQLHLSNAQYQHGVETDAAQLKVSQKNAETQRLAEASLSNQKKSDAAIKKAQLAINKFSAQTRATTAKMTAANRAASISAANLKAQGYSVTGKPLPGYTFQTNPTTGQTELLPPKTTYSTTGTVIATKAPTATASSAKTVAAAWRNLQSDARKLTTKDPITGKSTPTLDAQVAFDNLYANYAAILTPLGVAPVKIQTQVRAALRLAGYKRAYKVPAP